MDGTMNQVAEPPLDHQSRDAQLPSVVRPLFFNLIDRKLDVDAAAAVIQQWSDKMRRMPRTEEQVERDTTIPEEGRRWSDIDESGRELFRLMVYRIACALIGEHVLEADPHALVDVVRQQSERVMDAGAMADDPLKALRESGGL